MVKAKKKASNPSLRKTQPGDESLAAIANSLLVSLQRSAPYGWPDYINASLRAAYKLGAAGSLREDTHEDDEDKTLSGGSGMTEAEERGHDLLMQQARELGQLGLKPGEVSFRLLNFETPDGVMTGLVPIIKPLAAQRLKIHHNL